MHMYDIHIYIHTYIYNNDSLVIPYCEEHKIFAAYTTAAVRKLRTAFVMQNSIY